MKKTKAVRNANRTAMRLIILVVVVLGIVIAVQSHRLNVRIRENNDRLAEVSQQLQDEQDRTQEIRDLEEYMQTDEYLEKVAKEKLGLVKDNEIIFKEED